MSESAEERASRAAASVASLRAAGVEVVTRDDAAPGAAASLPELLPDAPPFTYVRLPADGAEEVGELSAPARAGDSLPALLAPCFAIEQAMDPETVARETAARLKGMMIGGGAQEGGLKAPGVDSLQVLYTAIPPLPYRASPAVKYASKPAPTLQYCALPCGSSVHNTRALIC